MRKLSSLEYFSIAQPCQRFQVPVTDGEKFNCKNENFYYYVIQQYQYVLILLPSFKGQIFWSLIAVLKYFPFLHRSLLSSSVIWRHFLQIIQHQDFLNIKIKCWPIQNGRQLDTFTSRVTISTSVTLIRNMRSVSPIGSNRSICRQTRNNVISASKLCSATFQT